MRRLVPAFALIACAVACSAIDALPFSSGIAKVSDAGADGVAFLDGGSVGGRALPVRDVVWYPGSNTDPRGEFALVEISDTPGLCANATANSRTRSRRSLLLTYANYDPGTQKTYVSGYPGDFPVFPPDASVASVGRDLKLAYASVLEVDTVCGQTTPASLEAVGGTVHLYGSDGGIPKDHVPGAFELRLRSGEVVTGTFEAATCFPLALPPDAGCK